MPTHPSTSQLSTTQHRCILIAIFIRLKQNDTPEVIGGGTKSTTATRVLFAVATFL